jgi:hypothetical protein
MVSEPKGGEFGRKSQYQLMSLVVSGPKAEQFGRKSWY